MKKLLALVLMTVMLFTFATGCSDPVYDDLVNFLNVEMQDVNADYEKLIAEVGTWETLADDLAIEQNISNVILPLIDDSLAKLAAINPETDEVKEIKAKYVKVLDTYKEGFEVLAEGCRTQDADTVNAGYDAINEAVALLDEYNAALEELAASVGAEVEY